ncbi:MAG: hypothetical protein KTR26_22145 [Flammeovirgaceae bacterium]|nr:hypothetical protein [Flammeovirgaceae bacterium]
MKILKTILLLSSTILTFSAFVLIYSPDFSAKKNRSFLLRDEGLSQLSFINLANPSENWFQPIPKGRDLQLIGKGKVMIGTENGFEERLISTGEKTGEITTFPETITARRLRNGNTILVGLNWENEKGIVLLEVNKEGSKINKIVYPDFIYARLLRETPQGNFLITANDLVVEGNRKGEIVWKAKVGGRENPHAWQAIRLPEGKTIVASGYGGSIQIFNEKSNLVKAFCGPEEKRGNFYSGLQILKNGNLVVANWQGHGPDQGNEGTQLLEFSADGKLVWSWKQDPTKFSSIQGVIILDHLDLDKLHFENENGILNSKE